MVALSVGKKRELGVLSSMLAKTVWTVGLVAILVSCGSGGYGGSGYKYTVGGTVNGLAGSGLVLQNNAGDDLIITASGVFSFHTPVANGNTYAITVKTYPSALSQTCTASNVSGTIDAAPVNNVVVNCVTLPNSVTIANPPGKLFAYRVNYSPGNISAYAIETTGPVPPRGTLTEVTTSPFTAGTNPTSFAIDPLGRFAYAVNCDLTHNTSNSNISAYKIDPTGALTNPTTVAAGINPCFVTVDPDGNFAYAANLGDNTISAYTIDPGTGALTAAGTAVTTGMYPTSVTVVKVAPSVEFVYVANNSSNTISVYTIDQTTTPGALIPGTAVAAGTNPFSVTIANPPGKFFAYVANFNSANISVYEIDQITTPGALIVGTTVAAGTNPTSVTVANPPGKFFAYVANLGSNNIFAYTIDATTGALTAVAGSPFDTGAGTNPTSVTIANPPGKFFAYVANYTSHNIAAYIIDPGTGALTAAGSPVDTGAGTNPTSVTVDPTGSFAYVENAADNSILAYTIDPGTGALTAVP